MEVNAGSRIHSTNQNIIEPSKFRECSDAQSTSHPMYSADSAVQKKDISSTRPCAVIAPENVIPPYKADAYVSHVWPQGGQAGSAYFHPTPVQYAAERRYPPRNISPRHTFQENMNRIIVPSPTEVKMRGDPYIAQAGPNHQMAATHKASVPSDSKVCDGGVLMNRSVELLQGEPGAGRRPTQPHSTQYSIHGYPAKIHNPAYPNVYAYNTDHQRYPLEYQNHRIQLVKNNQIYQKVSEQPPYLVSSEYPAHTYTRVNNIRYEPYSVADKYMQQRYDYYQQAGQYPTEYAAVQKGNVTDAKKRSFPQADLRYYHHMPHKYMESYPLVHSDYRTKIPTRRNQNNVSYHLTDISAHSVDPYSGHSKIYGFNICDKNSQQLGYPRNVAESSKAKADCYAQYPNVSYAGVRFAHDSPQSVAFSRANVPLYPMKPPDVSTYAPLNTSTYQKPPSDLQHSRIVDYDLSSQKYYYNQRYASYNPLARIPTEFSPNVISPSDSTTSYESANTTPQQYQEDGGYVSQCSTTSAKSADFNPEYGKPHPHMYQGQYSNHEKYASTNVIRRENTNRDGANTTGNNETAMNLKKYLEMWDEQSEDPQLCKQPSDEKTITDHQHQHQHGAQTITEHINIPPASQLYVLDKTSISPDELHKYDHIQKVTKLPDNIQDFPQITSSDRTALCNPLPYTQNQSVKQQKVTTAFGIHPNYKPQGIDDNTMSSDFIDVEAKISQSIIHKDVGCNFEIKPCSPGKPVQLNIDIAPGFVNGSDNLRPYQSVNVKESAVNPENSKYSLHPKKGNITFQTKTHNCEIQKPVLPNVSESFSNTQKSYPPKKLPISHLVATKSSVDAAHHGAMKSSTSPKVGSNPVNEVPSDLLSNVSVGHEICTGKGITFKSKINVCNTGIKDFDSCYLGASDHLPKRRDVVKMPYNEINSSVSVNLLQGSSKQNNTVISKPIDRETRENEKGAMKINKLLVENNVNQNCISDFPTSDTEFKSILTDLSKSSSGEICGASLPSIEDKCDLFSDVKTCGNNQVSSCDESVEFATDLSSHSAMSASATSKQLESATSQNCHNSVSSPHETVLKYISATTIKQNFLQPPLGEAVFPRPADNTVDIESEIKFSIIGSKHRGSITVIQNSDSAKRASNSIQKPDKSNQDITPSLPIHILNSKTQNKNLKQDNELCNNSPLSEVFVANMKTEAKANEENMDTRSKGLSHSIQLIASSEHIQRDKELSSKLILPNIVHKNENELNIQDDFKNALPDIYFDKCQFLPKITEDKLLNEVISSAKDSTNNSINMKEVDIPLCDFESIIDLNLNDTCFETKPGNELLETQKTENPRKTQNEENVIKCTQIANRLNSNENEELKKQILNNTERRVNVDKNKPLNTTLTMSSSPKSVISHYSNKIMDTDYVSNKADSKTCNEVNVIQINHLNIANKSQHFQETIKYSCEIEKRYTESQESCVKSEISQIHSNTNSTEAISPHEDMETETNNNSTEAISPHEDMETETNNNCNESMIIDKDVKSEQMIIKPKGENHNEPQYDSNLTENSPNFSESVTTCEIYKNVPVNSSENNIQILESQILATESKNNQIFEESSQNISLIQTKLIQDDIVDNCNILETGETLTQLKNDTVVSDCVDNPNSTDNSDILPDVQYSISESENIINPTTENSITESQSHISSTEENSVCDVSLPEIKIDDGDSSIKSPSNSLIEYNLDSERNNLDNEEVSLTVQDDANTNEKSSELQMGIQESKCIENIKTVDDEQNLVENIHLESQYHSVELSIQTSDEFISVDESIIVYEVHSPEGDSLDVTENNFILEVDSNMSQETLELVPEDVATPDMCKIIEHPVVDDNELEIDGCWIDDIACIETVVSEDNSFNTTDCEEVIVSDELIAECEEETVSDELIHDCEEVTVSDELIPDCEEVTVLDELTPDCEEVTVSDELTPQYESCREESNNATFPLSPLSTEGPNTPDSDVINFVPYSTNDNENNIAKVFKDTNSNLILSISEVSTNSNVEERVGQDNEFSLVLSNGCNKYVTLTTTRIEHNLPGDGYPSVSDDYLTNLNSATGESKSDGKSERIARQYNGNCEDSKGAMKKPRYNECLTEIYSPGSLQNELFFNENVEHFHKGKFITKGAKKYIPPVDIDSFKCQLPLSEDKLILLKKKHPKNNHTVESTVHERKTIKALPFKKQARANFEDVLKKIDETNITWCKMKSKSKLKKLIPKMIIKKVEHGSHYTAQVKNRLPDLTGNRWQPWVYLSRVGAIEEMVKHRKSRVQVPMHILSTDSCGWNGVPLPASRKVNGESIGLVGYPAQQSVRRAHKSL